jgi:hypothetical protein
MNILLVTELVNKDGSRISGGQKIDQLNNVTASKETTDDYVHMTRQGVSRYNNYGRTYVGEDDETNSEVKEPKKIKKKIIKKKNIKENIFTKKEFDKEFVKTNNTDSIQTKIGELNSIRDTNPILIRKVGALKDIIEKNNASGEEKAVILNYLLGMDLTDIPSNQKEELKRRLF